ncbi:MAG: hypothetical protein GXW85_10060 [Clostridia bacterium]|nr:hypothetical protein [Clostridia bacterium]
MSDILDPLSFENLLNICLEDYYSKGKIFEIDDKFFYRKKNDNLAFNFNGQYLSNPIGPAAGPHTQLSQCFVAAYLLGARFFEAKTVQVIDGKEMREMISKPCIDVSNVGYNVEWSTELTVEEAKREYIKASVIMEVLAKELDLADKKDFAINISVGYDLKGIKSEKISSFIDDLKDARSYETFQECLQVLRQNIGRFRRFKPEDIESISPNITNSVTVSTMHGCKPEEILDIGSHLIKDKKLHTSIKLNPTLLGYHNVRKILDNLGYSHVTIREEDFENDLKYETAVEIIAKLMELGREHGVNVGIKLTNTLPVENSGKVLAGESMYLSGKPLFPIAIGVAEKFAQSFNGNIHISYSGGIDKNNILKVLKTGIAPVTFSTILLKPRGYINLKHLLAPIEEEHFSSDKLDVEALEELAREAKTDPNYKNKGERGVEKEDTLPTYDCFKVNCGICVDVCPTRANMRLYDDRFEAAYQIVHIENRCYECGNCHTFCTRGGFPYLKKVTVFANMDEFKNSKNAGLLKIGENRFQLRDEEGKEYICDAGNSRAEKSKLEMILETLQKEYPYLLYNTHRT